MSRVVLVVVFLLLASAGPAFAECAWVLWATSVLPTTAEEVWTVIGAYSEAEGGKRACDDFANRRTKALENDERAKRSMRSLVCLPDTVDPRGPKP